MERIDELNEQVCRSMQHAGVKKSFCANEIIFIEGDRADYLPIVCSGRVKIVRFPEPGRELILGFFEHGEIFGIAPALDGKNFPATAIAVEPTQLLMLPRPALLRMMNESSEISECLTRRMCGLLRQRVSTVNILAMNSADHRIAKTLLNLAGSCDANCPVSIPQRRQEIAEMSGLTIETAIRSIRKLEKRGYLSIVKRKVVIERLEPLRKLLQE